MEQIDVKKHTIYTLEFIFSESNKIASHVLNSISEIKRKSFLLFIFISSILSFSFFEITNFNYEYLILLIGSIIGLIFIIKNLFPSIIYFNGALPEKMINSYFDEFNGESLEKEYIATQIQNYNTDININKDEMLNMVSRFKKSSIIMLSSFCLFGFVFLLRFIKCLPI